MCDLGRSIWRSRAIFSSDSVFIGMARKAPFTWRASSIASDARLPKALAAILRAGH